MGIVTPQDVLVNIPDPVQVAVICGQINLFSIN